MMRIAINYTHLFQETFHGDHRSSELRAPSKRENFGSGEFVTVTELTEIKMLKFVFIAFDDGDILFAPLFFFLFHTLQTTTTLQSFFAGAVFPFHLQIIYFVVDSQQHYVVN